MKQKKIQSNLLLLLIIIVGVVLRISGVVNIDLKGDFAQHWQIASKITSGEKLPFLGPSASVQTDLRMGPIYYYFLTLLYLISFGNYKLAIIIFSLFNIFSILIFYQLVKIWFGKDVGLMASGLLAISRYGVEFGNYPWNPYFLPFFLILALYSLIKIQTDRRYFLLLSFSLGIAIQLHPSVFLILPVFLVGVFLLRKKITIRWILLAIGIFCGLNLPFLVGEANQNFAGIQSGVSVFLEKTEEECNFQYWLKNHGHGERCFHFIRNPLFFLRFFAYSLFGTRHLLVLPLILAMLIYFILRIKIRLKKFILLWLAFPLLVFLVYSSNIYLHYFLIYIPLPFIIFSLVVKDLRKRFSWGDKLFKVLLAIVIVANICGNYHLLISPR